MAIMLVLAITVSIGVPAAVGNARERAAEDQLVRLKRAVVGTPRLVELGQRNINRFGYVADMGSLPSSIQDLAEIGVQLDFVVESITQLGHGWRGPYLLTAPMDLLEDPWGHPVVFAATTATSAFTGAPLVATIKIPGPDGTIDTSDDRLIEIAKGEAFSRVFGYVRRNGSTLAGIDVKLTYPAAGAVATSTIATDQGGFFEFLDVPHGDRVFEVMPLLAYKADTGLATSNNGDDVEFVVENLGKDSTTISSFTLTYTSDPPAYYKKVKLNGNTVYDDNTPRKGTGDSVTFANEAVTGTGVTQEPLHALVSSQVFQIPDIAIGSVGTGGTLKIELENFDDVASGNGAVVDMTGVTFRVDFSDGSVTFFTANAEP